MKPTRTLSHWQIYTLSATKEQLRTVRPDVELDVGLVVTGTVVDDPTGKWQPGFHMRSTVAQRYDEEQGLFETENTIYKLTDPQGDPTTNGDWGDNVVSLFY